MTRLYVKEMGRLRLNLGKLVKTLSAEQASSMIPSKSYRPGRLAKVLLRPVALLWLRLKVWPCVSGACSNVHHPPPPSNHDCVPSLCLARRESPNNECVRWVW